MNRTVKAKSIGKCSFLAGFLEYGRIIFSTSSAHGFSHIAARNHHYLERVLWATAVGCGVLGAAWLSLSTWGRYQSNPTVISLEKNYLDWNTTFPAVTLCPVNKIDIDQAQATASQILSDMSPEEGVKRLELLANASYVNFDSLLKIPGLQPTKYLETYWRLLYNFNYSLSNSNSDEVAFMMTVTESGLCYTYNSLVARYMDPVYWKENKFELETPLVLFRGNPLDGDIFAQVMDMNSAAKISIHGPEDLPEADSRWISTIEKYYLTVEFSALTIYSSKATRGLSVSQRKCRFLEESNLETSPAYSYNICRAECRMRLALRLCGCVPYFYRNSGKYKTCNVEGMHCLSRFKVWLRKLQTDEGQREKCGCYPSCDQVMYAVQTENLVPWFLGTNFKYALMKYPRTRLKRDVVFGVYDLLVQFGGSVGLCLGCSVLSVAEFAYFFTVRLYFFISNKFI